MQAQAFRLFTAALLLLGLFVVGGIQAATESGETEVYWDAVCWISFTVHSPIYLGTIDATAYATGYLEYIGPDGEMFIRTNCADGYTLEGEAIGLTVPDGFVGDVLADFRWWVAKYDIQGVDFVQETEAAYPGLNQKVLVASSTTPGNDIVVMAYKYYVDVDDIPGKYAVQIRYTVTSR